MTATASALPTAPDAGTVVAGLVATLGLWRERRMRPRPAPPAAPTAAGEAKG
ncbi:MAG: hypothetical protein AB7P02_09910 [Alphaproteobacteria bacterium]